MRVPNVKLVARERGKIVAVREDHNTWTTYGRQYLASQVCLTSYGPDTPERDDHIKYIGFGIGGVGQSQLSMVGSAPWNTVFPGGYDPHATTGNTYNHHYPIAPSITTLERPVPFTAVTGPTPGYSAPLAWRNVGISTTATKHQSHPGLYANTIPTVTGLSTFRFTGEYVMTVETLFVHNPMVAGGFDVMPLSEAALYLNSANPLQAFAPCVAYVTFDTIQITKNTDLFVEWDVKF